MAQVSNNSMDRPTLESASAAARHLQISELLAKPVLPDLPAPFLARCSPREDLSALRPHVPLHLASASIGRPSWPFCNRFHCRTIIFKMKIISISRLHKLTRRHGKSLRIYTSSTPPAQHCCWSGMHCGNRHTGSQESPVIKHQSHYTSSYILPNQTRMGILWSLHHHTHVSRHGLIYGGGWRGGDKTDK